jgi:hypothetical protein
MRIVRNANFKLAHRFKTKMYENKVNSGPRSSNGATVANAWHGTPELFAHIVRILASVTSEENSARDTLLIDVQVHEDHERFTSADEFLQNVTLEALRSFTRIDVKASSQLGQVHLVLRWRRPWWALGKGKDSVVELGVTGSDPNWIDSSRRTVLAATSRGWNKYRNNSIREFITAFCVGIVVGVTFLVVIYLFFESFGGTVLLVAFAASYIISAVVTMFYAAWLVPSLEIAPKGSSNLRRIIKTIGPVIAAIIIAGITKKLFKS